MYLVYTMILYTQVLLITVQLAFPSILRFAICIMILFIAFAFCGWLVIGPYHPKVYIQSRDTIDKT